MLCDHNLRLRALEDKPEQSNLSMKRNARHTPCGEASLRCTPESESDRWLATTSEKACRPNMRKAAAQWLAQL